MSKMKIHVAFTQDAAGGIEVGVHVEPHEHDDIAAEERWLKGILRLFYRYSPWFDKDWDGTDYIGAVLCCRMTGRDFRYFDDECVRVLHDTYGVGDIQHWRKSMKIDGQPRWVSLIEFTVDPDFYHTKYAFAHHMLDSAMMIAGCPVVTR